MQLKNTLINSRSVMVNPTLSKQIQIHKIKHQLKLREINNRKTQHQSINVEQIMKKKLSVKNAHERVNDLFQPSQFHKRSMINHIKEIYERKGTTFSEMKRYKNIIKQNEEKQIAKQNRMLFDKIKENREKMLTKKQLKKQFRMYEYQRSSLRKVIYEGQHKKGKKDHHQNSHQNLSNKYNE